MLADSPQICILKALEAVQPNTLGPKPEVSRRSLCPSLASFKRGLVCREVQAVPQRPTGRAGPALQLWPGHASAPAGPRALGGHGRILTPRFPLGSGECPVVGSRALRGPANTAPGPRPPTELGHGIPLRAAE